MAKFFKLGEPLKKERMLSLANIMVMTITFLILGLFLMLVFVSQSTLSYLEQQTQITAFFKDDFGEDQIVSLKEELMRDERVYNVEYISKEDALEIFTEINKDEPLLLEAVTANILPASLNIQTKKVEDLQVLAEQLNQNEGVEGVRYFEEVMSSFQQIAQVIYLLGFLLSGMFLFISFSAIIITLRIFISRKGREIEILKLVGASNSFVQRPIIAQGVFFSFISSFLAAMVIILGALLIEQTYFSGELIVPFAEGFTATPFVLGIATGVILIVSGIILGLLASKTAVIKYLKF